MRPWVLSLLVSLLAGAASPAAFAGALPDAPAAEPEAAPEEDSDEPGFFARHFPFGFDERLAPEIDEDLDLIWILLVPLQVYGGPIIVGPLVTGQSPGPNFFRVALRHYVYELVVLFAGVGTLMLVGLVLPYGFIVLYPIAALYALARLVWFGPVSAINLYNRALWEQRGQWPPPAADDDDGPAAAPNRSREAALGPAAIALAY